MAIRLSHVVVAACSCLLSPNALAEKGLLLIKVDAIAMNSSGSPTGTGVSASYRVANLKTKDTFAVCLTDRVCAEELDEGFYCLYSVSPYPNLEIPYCDEPYFQIAPKRVNNAGYWRFLISLARPVHQKLVFAAKHGEEVLSEAKQYRRDDLRKYGMAQEP